MLYFEKTEDLISQELQEKEQSEISSFLRYFSVFNRNFRSVPIYKELKKFSEHIKYLLTDTHLSAEYFYFQIDLAKQV